MRPAPLAAAAQLAEQTTRALALLDCDTLVELAALAERLRAGCPIADAESAPAITRRVTQDADVPSAADLLVLRVAQQKLQMLLHSSRSRISLLRAGVEIERVRWAR